MSVAWHKLCPVTGAGPGLGLNFSWRCVPQNFANHGGEIAFEGKVQ